jgi:hypothetical protein
LRGGSIARVGVTEHTAKFQYVVHVKNVKILQCGCMMARTAISRPARVQCK